MLWAIYIYISKTKIGSYKDPYYKQITEEEKKT